MLFYEIRSGTWASPTGAILVTGCEAGNDNVAKDMNNPASVGLRDRGPLPPGRYSIGPLGYQAAVRSQGCLLTPFPENDMLGRSGFYLHLRNSRHLAPDGTNASSDGCITFAAFSELASITAAAVADDRTVMVVASLHEPALTAPYPA
jgi:hypothetical protein